MTSRFVICIFYFIIFLGNPTEYLKLLTENNLTYNSMGLHSNLPVIKQTFSIYSLYILYFPTFTTFMKTAIINYFIGSKMW